MVKLDVHSLGAQGNGIADYNDGTVFLDNALLGETITASITPDTKNIYRGTAIEIHTPSPDRTHPPCPHFNKCGGCTLQHMAIPAYQTWKADSVKSYLTSKNIIPKTWDAPIFIPANTRRRATFSALKQGQTLILGYHQSKSNMIFDVKECALLAPELESLIPILKSALTPITENKQKLSIFIQQADNGIDMVITGKIGAKSEPDLQAIEAIVALSQSTNIIRISWRKNDKNAPETMIERLKPIITFGDLTVPLAPLAFLQPSKEGELALAETIKAYFPNGTDLKAIDLFSGCGTFTGHVRSKCCSIDAYESDCTAIQNLKTGGHKQAYIRDLFRDPLTENELFDYDVAMIDPPRAGALEQTKILAWSDVKKIISISCNPATFARDAQILIDGGYTLKNLTIIDQFIWSAHSEIIANFIHD